MATVTFYKTKFNRSNRAYDSAALSNILNAAPSTSITVNPSPVPNQDFFITNTPTTAATLLLGGYDYISYNYAGATWYSFIDDMQAIASQANKYRISHTTDIWAMACVNFMGANGTFHMNGTLERAHVNDLKASTDFPNTTAYADMRNTFATCEVNYNTALIKKKRQSYLSAMYSGMRYLYLYIANPREIGIDVSADSNQQRFLLGSEENHLSNVNSQTNPGLLAVYPISYGGTCYYRDTSGAGDSGGVFDIQDLTSSAITAMYISTIPPCSYSGNFSGMESGAGVSVALFRWDRNAPNIDDFVATKPNTTDGLPPYINWFRRIYGIGYIPYACYDASPILNGNIGKQSIFSEYIKQIPKMRTTIYNPIIINGYRVPPQVGQSSDEYELSNDFKQCVTPDLEYIISSLPNDWEYTDDLSSIIIENNNAVFASATVLDYWTRLNAKQSTISANQAEYQAVAAPVASLISAAGDFATGKIASGVSALAKTAVSVGNSVYNIQSAQLAKEAAQQQYNAGTTRAGTTTGMFSSTYDSAEAAIEVFSCELQYDVIAPNLHRYGYNTFLQIDEIYANHKRKYFNYFKGINVQVSGMPLSWCNEIADMFNNGVTLWQSDVENYERCNYQANLNW